MTTLIFERIIKGLTYTTFFIPLIVFPDHFIYPFIFPKVVILRSLIALIVGCYAALLAINWETYRPQKSALNLSVALFFASLAISSFFGVDVHRSLWDTQERMLGFVTLLHYAFYYFIVTQIFKKWSDWKIALNIFLVAGLLVMITGWFNPYGSLYPENRVIATLGNPVFLGGYCLFLIFLTLLLFFDAKTIILQSYYGVCTLAILRILFLTGTRGVIVAFFLGMGMLFIGYLISSASRKKKFLFACLTTGWIGLAAFFYLPAKEKNAIHDISPVERLFNISHWDLETPRIMAWKSAIKGWQERPVLGWGPNNFTYVYTKYYSPAALRFGIQETRMDNAHNVLLNTLAVQGIIGILSYLAIYVIAFQTLYKGYKREILNIHFFLISCAFLFAHLIMNITTFDHPTSYLYFFLWLAMINSLTSLKKEEQSIQKSPKVFVFLILSLTCLTIVFLNVQPAIANHQISKAISQFYKEPSLSISQLKELLHVTNTPYHGDINFMFSKIIIDHLLSRKGELMSEKGKKLSTVIFKILQHPLLIHPMDIQVYLLKGKLYRIQGIQNQNRNLLIEAKKYLLKGLEISPHFQELMIQLALVELELGRKTEGLEFFEKAIKEDEWVVDIYRQYAQVCYNIGMKDKAEEIIARSKKFNLGK